MTVNVVPDELGPVTVRAHLAADGIRIEMLAASDAGREGLRHILGDLRRDLALGGMTATLSVGQAGSGSAAAGSGFAGAGPDAGFGQGQHQGTAGRGSQGPGGPAQEQEGRGSSSRQRVPDSPHRTNSSLDITV